MLYAGGCRFVVDGLIYGITPEMVSSRSPMADLWKQAQWLLDDHGASNVRAAKVKAHRSRKKALDEGGHSGVIDWYGNAAADYYAKELAKLRWREIEAEGRADGSNGTSFEDSSSAPRLWRRSHSAS